MYDDPEAEEIIEEFLWKKSMEKCWLKLFNQYYEEW